MIKRYILFFLLFGFQLYLAQSPAVCFSPGNNSVAAGNQQSGIATADFNNDTNPDLVFSNYNNGIFSFAFGNGTGGFSAPVSQTISGVIFGVKTADFNNDGNADIIFASSFPQRAVLLLGTGTGSFSSQINFTTSPSGTFAQDVAVSDFNSDGNMDIAISNIYDPSVSVLLGTGTGSFLTPYIFSVGTATNSEAQRLCTGDFNNDGNPDIAVSDYMTSSFSVLLGIGTGSFNAATVYTLSGGSIGICTVNANNDGNIDLALTLPTNSITQTYIGLGNGSFTAGAITALGVEAYAIAGADINSDGNSDLVTANYSSNNMNVLLGQGNGTFVIAGTYTAGSYPYDIIASDFNKDGLKDVAVANSNASFGSVYINGLPNLTVTATPSIVCSGNTSTLLASGANTYTWVGGPSSASYAISPTVTANYTVNATKAATGCTNTAVINVSVISVPALSITSSGTVVCAGNSVTLTASGASTYTWSGGPTTANYTMSPGVSTTYTLSGTSASGCTAEATQQVSVNPTPNLTVSANPNPVCFGATSTLSASGANTYTWNGGTVSPNYIVTPNINTTYTVVGTSASGCTSSAFPQVTVISTPTLALLGSTLICSGESSTLSASGANTYTWSGGPVSSTYAVNPTITTTYTVSGTAVNGCTSSATRQVSVNATPVLTISATSTLLCSGNSSTLTGNGASTYTWSGGPGTSTYAVSPLTTTTYSLFASSAAGCTATASRQVSVNPTPTLNISPSSTVICSGSSATLTAGGAVSYSWSSGPLTPGYVVSPVVTTNYTVTGTTNGCTNTAVQSVSVNSTPVLTLSPSSTVICTGKSATLNASGASSYSWVSGPSTSSYVVSPLSNTNYTVIGTAAGGCSSSAIQAMSVNTTPVPSISPSSTVMCTGNTVTLTASGAGTYTWTAGPAGNTYTVSPLVNTTYTVTGTTNGCTNTAVQSISVNTTPTISISPSSTVICSGKSATLLASGASNYTWSGGPVFPSYVVSPTLTTNYTVTGTALNGCTNSAQQSLSVNATPTLTIIPSSSVTCANVSQTLTASGALTYSWSGGPATASLVISPTVSTVFSVSATAANSCTNTASQSVSVIALPVLTITPSSSVICSGFSSTLTASGASTYSWSGGPNTNTYVVTPPFTTSYTVSATAVTGCSNSAVGSISVNATPTLVITPSNTLYCIGTPYVMTGSGAATYNWVGGPGTATYSVNPAVTTVYTLNAASVAGCSSTAQYTVVFNAPPVLTITPSSTVICSNKTATLIGTGANTYTWISGPLSDIYLVVNPPVSATYTLLGTAVNGCTASASQNLSVNPAPVMSITPSASTICQWNTATLTAAGAPNYTWTGGPVNSSYTVSPFASTIYTVTGTAVNGCTSSAVQTLSIITTPALTVTASSSLICSGSSSTLSASGAVSYTWTGGPVNPVYVISPTLTGNYAVLATSANGCTLSAVKTISVNATPVVSIVPSSSVICSNISSTLTALGAGSYTWAGGPAGSSYVVSPTVTTSYSVTGASNGCSNTAVQTISVNAAPSVSIVPSNTSICVGSSITLSGAGATTYTWNTGSTSPSITVSPSLTTSYTLFGTTGAAGGCSNVAVTTLTVHPSPVISVNSGSVCAGNSFSIIPSGASSYSISGGTWIVSPTVTTLYTVSATSSLGCLSLNNPVSTVIAHPRPTVTVNSGSICPGGVFVIQPSGAATYTFSSGSPTVYPLSTTVYSVTGTSSLGCSSSNTALSQVVILATPTIVVSNGSICAGGSFVINPSGAVTYTYSSGSPTVSPATTSTYAIVGSNAAGCVSSNTPVIQVTVFQNPTISVNSGTVCLGGSMVLSAGGANTYSWSTGANTPSIVASPSVFTVYSVTGTDLNQCQSSGSATVVVVPQLVVGISATSPSLCQGGTATLSAFGANNFTWSTGSSSPSIVANLSVTTNFSVFGSSGSACTNTAALTITVIPLPQLNITGQGFGCAGNNFTLVSSGANTYTWNTGATGSVLIVNPSSSTGYTVTGSNGFNCSNSSSIQVNVTTPVTPSICMVTVDSIGTNNEIYWDKSLFPEADTFIVYRETNIAQYSVIARLSKNAPGHYLDTNRSLGPYIGNPNLTSYKYKIQYRDTCGNLSNMSSYHQTIHVQDQQNGNFSWNPYFVEWGGASVGYILWRYNVLTGVTTTVGYTSGSIYTDPGYAAIATTGNTKWYVSTDGFNCNTNLKSNGQSAAAKTRTKSNNTNERQFPGGNGSPTGLNEQAAFGELVVYPNPASDELIIKTSMQYQRITLKLIDLTGRVLIEEELEGELSKLNTKAITNGSYLITLLPETGPGKVIKVIIQH